MPRNLSAWIDLTVHLVIMLVMIGLLASYNTFLAAVACLVWICLAFFAWERCVDRRKRFERYCLAVVRNLNEMMNYAIEDLPQAIFLVDKEGRIQWSNDRIAEYIGKKPEQNTDAHEIWPNLIIEPVWGTVGEYVFSHEERYYKVHCRPVSVPHRQPPLMAFYLEDVTDFETLRTRYQMSRTVLVEMQIDNYDEVVQGQSDAERTALILAVNQQIGSWVKSLGGFMRRVSEDRFLVVLDRAALDRAIEEKFDVLDKVRQMHSANRLPITLSMGVAVAEEQPMEELGSQAQAELDLALGRGGDQVAVQKDGKNQFFGGRTKAIEKHTRVKARVVAHAIREIMENADGVYVMGHHNEDFDCFGAAIGVAKMARDLGKPVHIILSTMNEGIDKIVDLFKDKEGYENLFVHTGEAMSFTATHPVLIVVDTHIPHLVADPALLGRSADVVVIDHHRRSEHFVKNPLLVYIEPSSSSTSELVTELLMYFSDRVALSRLDATALYSGIVVDTKNFAVQTGVRTFDAAAYLRRSGADPVMVRHLFRTDFETTVALAKAKTRAEYYEGGLIVTTCPEVIANGQIIAAQAADSLLRVEKVRMSIVVFQLTADTVGISARSTGEMNVQVIMEAFGGGGHQNVAGAQVKGGDVEEIKAKAIALAKKYMEENDQDESHTEAGR